MRDRYLEVTYRKGRAVAGYLYLPRPHGTKIARTAPFNDHLLIDFGPDGEPIGLEIVDPRAVSVADVDTALRSVGLDGTEDGELAPLAA